MFKSCQYCGRVHKVNYICPHKPKRVYKDYKGNPLFRKFRSSKRWTDKAIEIKRRDNYLCQICIRQYRYVYDNLSVHHIIGLANDFDKRLDDDNLITLCASHHDEAERGIIDVKTLIDIVNEQEYKRR